MNNILLINQSPGYLFVDLVHAAQKCGYKVSVIVGQIPDGLPSGVDVHCFNAYIRGNNIVRFISWLLFAVRSFFYILYRRKKIYSVLSVTNPPLMLFILPLLGVSYSILLYDMYPQILSATKLIKKDSILYRLLEKVSCRGYRLSQSVFVLSNGMLDELNNQCESVAEAYIVPLWHNMTKQINIPSSNISIFKRMGINANFVVMYSGNLGNTHPLEDLILSSDYLSDGDIHILMVGEGAKKERLKKMSKDRCNVTVLPFQTVDIFSDMLQRAAVAVVCLDSGSSAYSVPSKSFNAMACGRPILVIAGQNAEISRLVEKNTAGIVVEPGNPKLLASSILNCKYDESLLNQMSDNSYQLSKQFTNKNADLIISKWLNLDVV